MDNPGTDETIYQMNQAADLAFLTKSIALLFILLLFKA